MKKIIALLAIGVLLFLGFFALSTTGASATQNHIRIPLVPVEDSGVTGYVALVSLPEEGTKIRVVAQGLVPGEEYVSLYYENHTCELEPYGEDDVIGGTYIANSDGFGMTSGIIDDDLDEIDSVSVRRNSDFALLSCADNTLAP